MNKKNIILINLTKREYLNENIYLYSKEKVGTNRLFQKINFFVYLENFN
jgi:hypothetical protein